jgi:hypothetical protein
VTVSLIGTATGASPQNITVPAGGVPASAHIIVFASDAASSGTIASITDTAGNTYSNGEFVHPNNVQANGQLGIYRERTGLALNSGDTITYTSAVGGSQINIAAIYVTDLMPVAQDGATGTGGNGTAASSGTFSPSGAPRFVVGCAVSNTTQSSLTQSANFVNLPGVVSLTAPALIAGWGWVGSGSSGYSATLGTSAPWAAGIAFYDANMLGGWETQPVQPPSRANAPNRRGGAIRSRSEFGIFPNLQPMGWEVQPPQPPHPAPERRGAATMRGHDGIDDIRRVWVNRGEEVQPVQPPHPRPEARAGAIMRGDDGVYDKLRQWFNVGNQQESGWQPPHPRSERSGAVARGDDGNYDTFRRWFNLGWEQTYSQQPHLRVERSGAIQVGDHGTQAVFIPPAVATVQWGYELSFQPPHPRPERGGAIRNKSEFGIFPNLLPVGYEVQFVQPSHPRPERSGSIQVGDQGTQAAFVPPAIVPWGFEQPQWQPAYRLQRGAAIAGTIEFAIPIPPVVGWDVKYVDLKRPPVRSTGIQHAADNVYAPLVQWFNVGYEVQAPSPPRPRPERSAAVMRGDDGTQAPFSVWKNGGWEVASHQPGHPKPERSAAIAIGDHGTQAVFVPPVIVTIQWGYEQSFQPPHPRREQRIAGTKGGTGFAIFPNLLPAGWEVVPFQPPHTRPERSGAIQLGESGIEAALVQPVPPTAIWGFEAQWPQPTYKLQRGAAIRGRDSFLPSSPLVVGWEALFLQPPRPRPEKSGAIQIGDSGTEAPFVFVPPPAWGWDVQPVQPSHPWPERRSAAIMRGDDGTQGTLTQFVQFGWPVQSPQPPHPRPERSGSIQVGDSGTQAIYIVQSAPTGWDFLTTTTTFHKRPENAGAGAVGDSGTQALFTVWHNYGWEVAPVQPPHPRPERFGSIARGDDGIQLMYIPIFSFAGAGGLTVSASFIQHICVIPGPGPATLPSEPGPGPKVC